MERDCDPIQKPEGDVDGDNLILNPEKLKKKLQDIKLDKLGRPQEKDPHDLYSEQLILNVKDDIIKP